MCGAAAIADVSLYGAGLLGARRIERTALGRCTSPGLGRTSLEFAGGDRFRATGAIVPVGSELTSGFADDLDSAAGDDSESVERASAEYSEPRVLFSGFPSEGVASPNVLAPTESSERATGGVGVREVDSSS